MTMFATFQCLECEHFWREPAPGNSWEVAITVAAVAVCPLCGARMREGNVEWLSHKEGNFAVLGSTPHAFASPK
ncbi:MAG: hypothetical protein ACOZF2_04970 [Thermodesulfobacteriota bacterium]